MQRFVNLLKRLKRNEKGARPHMVVYLFAAISLWLPFLGTRAPSLTAAQEQQSPLRGQPPQEADRKSAGCITCHTSTDEPTMHPSKAVHLGCTDCHGGNLSLIHI